MNSVVNIVKNERTLIASHRGSYGASIPCNTLAAFDIALRQGADIIETDIQRCADGSLFLFHSGLERAFLGDASINLSEKTADEIGQLTLLSDSQSPTWYRLPRLDDALEHLKGRCLINLDRCENFWEKVIAVVDRHNMADQIILKSRASEEYIHRAKAFAHRIMYMPVVMDTDDASETLSAMNIPFAGLEVVFRDESSHLCSAEYIDNQHKQNRFLWVNSLNISRKSSLCAGHDDEISMINDPAYGWGWLINRGFDIIQTDWVSELHAHINAR